VSDDFEIVPSAGVTADVCARLMLSSDPWKTLGYGPEDTRLVAEASPRGQTLIARGGDEVLGFALSVSGFLNGDYLRLLVVDPQHRSLGIGRRLLEHLEGQVFARAKNLYLCVTDFNTRAREFYRRQGYVEIGPIPDLLIAGSAEILMRKSVGPTRSR
jgi:ribosomal protein S18 acetylase RimI-like enzyme